MFTRLRNLVGLKPREPKPRTHKLLQSVKYAGLFLILLLVIMIGTSSYTDSNVAAAYKAGLPGEAHKEPACLVCPAPITTCFMPDTARDIYAGTLNMPPLAIMSLLIFISFVIGSFYIPRFFCRYFCYLGALGSMFGRSSLMTLRKDVSKCSHCGTCSRGCPMKISRVEKEKKDTNVSSSECVMCLECVGNCPEKALSLKFAGKDVYRGATSWWKRKTKGKAS
jgi:Pyruvate/2-oxoacid:ferredoxin oxidoreductase delta subunit